MKVLSSLERVDVPEGFDAELVVVDNGSTDGTSDVLASATLSNMQLRTVSEPRAGAGHARNAALEAARGDILFFTDDDMRLPEDWITGLAAPILTGDADAVVGKVVIPQDHMRPWMEPFHRTALASTEALVDEDRLILFGGSMAMHRRVLERVPAFDTELGPGTEVGALEDTLFSLQLRVAGFKLVSAFDIVAEHHFDLEKLTRASFLRAAASRGRAISYIRYHWDHAPRYTWTHRRHVWQFWRNEHVVLAKRLFELRMLRILRRADCTGAEGIARWEFNLVNHINQIRQFLRDRKRSRNYPKYGLARIDYA
jgi:glycosyltransferase involved in cell wall biosynthesis